MSPEPPAGPAETWRTIDRRCPADENRADSIEERQMARISWERLAALAGLAFVVLYVVAFALGIEVGDSDREILDYYGDSGNRAKEVVAFFLIAGAALSLAVFATALRSIITRFEQENAMLAAVAWAGGIGCAALILAGNAVSRATAFAAMDEDFQLNPDTRDLFETAGFLLIVSGALAAILLVVGVSLAARRHGVLPRWLAWAGFGVAALLPLAIGFVGFLVFVLWVIAASAALALGRTPATAARPEATR
jgi:magnesium-transporting ATPase (P-type)